MVVSCDGIALGMPTPPQNEAEKNDNYPTDGLETPNAVSQVYLDFLDSFTHGSSLPNWIFLLGFDFISEFVRIVGHMSSLSCPVSHLIFQLQPTNTNAEQSLEICTKARFGENLPPTALGRERPNVNLPLFVLGLFIKGDSIKFQGLIRGNLRAYQVCRQHLRSRESATIDTPPAFPAPDRPEHPPPHAGEWPGSNRQCR